MSYIDQNLLPDEQIIYRTKKHYIIFIVPACWIIAAVFFLINANQFVLMFAPVAAICALLTGSYQLLDYVTSEFAVTNKRIMMKEGFFFRHSNELRLATISNVTVNQSLLARILRYGTIIVSPFGSDTDTFSNIADPYQFQRQAQIQLDKIMPMSPPGR